MGVKLLDLFIPSQFTVICFIPLSESKEHFFLLSCQIYRRTFNGRRLQPIEEQSVLIWRPRGSDSTQGVRQSPYINPMIQVHNIQQDCIEQDWERKDTETNGPLCHTLSLKKKNEMSRSGLLALREIIFSFFKQRTSSPLVLSHTNIF